MKYQDNRHFSHDHFLFSLKIDEDDQEDRLCNACEEKVTEPFHGCIQCSYYLHDRCLKAPRSLQHQSHPSHPLTLLSVPTYSVRCYTCDACGGSGNGFSYGCAHCEFDLHFKCASFPNSAMHGGIHPHELILKFDTHGCGHEGTVLACGVCGGSLEKNRWLYYCSKCEFGAHLYCANNNVGWEYSQSTSVGVEEEEEDSDTDIRNRNIQETKETLEIQNKNRRQRIKRLINLKN